MLTPIEASLTSPGASWALREKKKKKKKRQTSVLPPSSSSPALIPHRIQSRAVWGHGAARGVRGLLCSGPFFQKKKRKEKSGESPAAGGADVAGGGGGGCLVRWRQSDRGGILPRCVKMLWRRRARRCSHSLARSVTPGDFLSPWSGLPALTVRCALPLTSHLKGEGLISRWRRCQHAHASTHARTLPHARAHTRYPSLAPCHINANKSIALLITLDWLALINWQPLRPSSSSSSSSCRPASNPISVQPLFGIVLLSSGPAVQLPQ